MIVKKWILLLLFVASGPIASGAEEPGAIWWASEGRGRFRGGGKPGGPVAEEHSDSVHPHSHSKHGPGDPHDSKQDEQPGNENTPAKERRSPPEHARKRVHQHGEGPPDHVLERMRNGEGPPAHVMERTRQHGGAPPHSMPPEMMAKTDEGHQPPGHTMHHEGASEDRRGGKDPAGAHNHSASRGHGEGKMPNRAEMMAAMRKPKPMMLRWGDFPATAGKDSELGRLVEVENLQAWIRTPDGSIVDAAVNAEEEKVSTKCPPESMNEDELPNGVYVVGMHLDAGVIDLDSDGEMERVHFYSTGLTTRFARDGESGEQPGVFFKAPDKVALEIGPVTTSTGRGGFMATSQRALEENKLQVLYQGQPLANAEVCVLSDSGWKNRLTTDEDGMLTVVPVGQKSDGRMRMTPSGQCLYVVRHKVEEPGEFKGAAYAAEYHCASLLMGVRMPGPEWKSKSEGVRLATVSGIGFLVLAGGFGIYRRCRRAHEIMIQFDRHRINRGDA